MRNRYQLEDTLSKVGEYIVTGWLEQCHKWWIGWAQNE